MRKIGSYVIAYVVLPVCLLLVMEGVARVAAPDRLRIGPTDRRLFDLWDGSYMYVNRAGFSGTVQGHAVHINNRHLRSRNDATDEPRRLLLLGDSVIFGMGLDDDEAAGVVLGEMLGDSVAVLNSGTIGYTTAHQLTFLQAFGDALRPDAVLLAYFLNDPWSAHQPTLDIQVQPTPADGEPLLVRLSRYKDQLQSFLRQHSYQYMWLRGALRPFLVRNGYEMLNYHHYGVLFNEHGKHWQENQTYLLEIVQWCRERGVPFGIAVFPHGDQLDDRIETNGNPQRLLRAFAHGAGIPFLDLRPALTPGDFLLGDPLHLNARGMRKSLAALAAFYAAELAPRTVLPSLASSP